MSALDLAPRHSLDGLEFPAISSKSECEIRHKLHEYPRVDGADTERQGRSLWRWTVQIPAHATFRAYPYLFPYTVTRLRKLHEEARTVPFVHPIDGTYQAWITKFEQNLEGNKRSGVALTLTIQEELSIRPVTEQLRIGVSLDGALAGDIAAIKAKLAEFDADTYELDLFDKLFQKLDEFFSYRNGAQKDLLGYQARLERIIELVQKVDASAKTLLNPEAWPIVQGLGRLMDAVVRIGTSPVTSGQIDAANAAGGATGRVTTGLQFRYYTVPRNMTVGQLSSVLYGDATHVATLLSFNVVLDPTTVKAGIVIRYV